MSDPLSEFLRGVVERGRMPGAVWCVAGPGAALARGAVGAASEATPYDLASLTKPLCTATLLLLAEADGAVGLEQPVARWLPELDRSPHGEASLSELATHTAGLAAWWPLAAAGGGRAAYLAAIAGLPRAVDRGRTLYSDLGYILLGIALERASGASLDVLFERHVAGPLGLDRLGFATDPERFSDAAATEAGNDYERVLAGERGHGGTWRSSVPRGQVHDANAWGLGGVAGHAGLFGTAAQVSRLAGELLEPRRLPLSHERRSVGWVIARHSRAACGILPDDAPGHTGFTGTSLWLEPARGRSYVLLTNRVHPRVPAVDFRAVRRGFHRLARRVEPPRSRA